MVVDGEVTTQAGPQKVVLTTTRGLTREDSKFKLFVEDAAVSISSSEGEFELLTEAEPGHYYTSSEFSGRAGVSYQLHITTTEGKEYVSTNETLTLLPAIDSLSIEYGIDKGITEHKSIIDNDGFYIKAWTQDIDTAVNYFKADWQYTYLIFTRGDAPNTCWAHVSPIEFQVFSDEISAQGAIADYPLFFLPVKGIMFSEKIKVKATFVSLSGNGARFWNGVYNTAFNQGGVLDPPPGLIYSNIHNPDEPQEIVLGSFSASDYKVVEKSIYARDFPGRIATDTGFTAPCLKYPVEERAVITDIEPEDWNE